MSSAFVTRSEIWVHHVSDFVLVFFPIVSKVDSVTRREIVQKLRQSDSTMYRNWIV